MTDNAEIMQAEVDAATAWNAYELAAKAMRRAARAHLLAALAFLMSSAAFAVVIGFR